MHFTVLLHCQNFSIFNAVWSLFFVFFFCCIFYGNIWSDLINVIITKRMKFVNYCKFSYVPNKTFPPEREIDRYVLCMSIIIIIMHVNHHHHACQSSSSCMTNVILSSPYLLQVGGQVHAIILFHVILTFQLNLNLGGRDPLYLIHAQ